MLTVAVLVLMALVFGYVGYPLFRSKIKESLTEPAQNHRLEELLSQKDTTYSAIKELEFEFEVGSLSKKDYQALDERYRKKATSLLKGIEEQEGDKEVEEEIESQIRELRQVQRKSPTCPDCGLTCPPGSGFCPTCGARLTLLCPRCGGTRREGFRFCAQCGANLFQESEK